MVEDDEEIGEHLGEEGDETHHTARHPLLLHTLSEKIRDYTSHCLSSPTQRVRTVEDSGQIQHPRGSEGRLVHGVGQISEDVSETHSVVDHNRQSHHQLHRLAQQTQRSVDRHRLPINRTSESHILVLRASRSSVRLHTRKHEHRSHRQGTHHSQHSEQHAVVVGELLDHSTNRSAEAASELEDGIEHTIKGRGGLGKTCTSKKR